MYLANKYSKWYYSIINNSCNRVIDGLIEKHHIIPKSLGGKNSKSNLANLTPREHFICHLLLTKMTTGAQKAKMVNAALRLSNDHKGRCVNSRLYDMIKRERIEFLKKEMTGARNPFYGKKHTEETRKKMSDARKKWSFTEEHLAKFRNRVGPMAGKTHSEETRLKLSAIGKLRVPSDETKAKTSKTLKAKEIKRSAETREKMRQAKLGIRHPKKNCEHCGKTITVAMYTRWHGYNCRFKGKSDPFP